MTAHPAYERGFTLFELLIVIVLVGLATAILTVGIGKGMQIANERSTLSQIVASLRSARVQAIGTGQPVRTTFDLAGRTVRSPDRTPASWPEDFVVRLHTAKGLGAAFEFYPDGAASGGNILITHGQKRWRIDVAWLTGNAQLRPLP